MAISLGSLVSLVHGALLFKSYPHGCQFCGWGGLCNTCLGWLMQEKMFIHAGFFFSRNPSIHFFLKEANHVWRDCGTCAIVQADLTPPGHLKEGHGLDMVGYPLFLLVRIAYDLKQSPFPQASVAWTSSIAIGSIKLHPPFWFVILASWHSLLQKQGWM